MNKSTAMSLIRSYGLKVTFEYDEFRVTYKNVMPDVAEANAYYTDDQDDAVDTARAMATVKSLKGTSGPANLPVIVCDFCGMNAPAIGADLACGGQGQNVACATCVSASQEMTN